jgi:hypothetical protein
MAITQLSPPRTNDFKEMIKWQEDVTRLLNALYNLKTGTDQSNAGAIAGELYADTNDDNTVKLGV